MLILDWIDTLGLLPPDPSNNPSHNEACVLELFGDAGRRAIVLEAITQVCSPQKAQIMAGLTSWTKVSALLELLGPALNLGLEDIQPMGKVVECYLDWLSGANWPAAIIKGSEMEAYFIETLIRHLSLLFRVRKTEGKGSVQQVQVGKQAELCRQVLRAFTGLSRGTIGQSTWKVVMLVMLGVADSLLRLPTTPPCQLADDLTSELLSSLVEVWLRSQSFSSSLWKTFKTYYKRWCHRLPAVSQWTAVSLALTQRISKHLYGQGTEAVTYAVNGVTVSLDGLEKRFELFAWKQHLTLIANPGEMPPANCLRAVLGVELLLQVFSAVGQTSDPASVPLIKLFPSANTLLALFGRWLFDAVTLDSPEYVESCAHATGILCRLFSKPQYREPIHPGYLHQFYQAMDRALKHPSLLVTVFICINCEDLLTAKLPGLRILAPGFLTALRRLVPRPQTQLQLNIRMEDLRRACYKLLCTLLTYSSHFSIPFTDIQPSNAYSEDLLRHFPIDRFAFQFTAIDTLISTLLAEDDAGNMRYLLNSLTTAAVDAAPSFPGLAGLWCRILSELLARSDNSADPETATVALQSLSTTGTFVNETELISMVIMNLCKTTSSLALKGPSDLLALSVDVLVSWSTSSPAATLVPETLSAVTKCIEQLFTVDGSRTGIAQLALLRLFTGLGPSFSDSPMAVSSRLTEFDFSQNLSELHYFFLNESVLACFVETCNEDGGEELAVVLRTPTGRYVWSAKPLYSEDTSLVESSLPAIWKEFKDLSLSEKSTKFIPDESGPVFNDTQFNKQLEQDPRRMKNLALIDGLCKRQAELAESCRLVDSPAHLSAAHHPPAPPSQQGKLARLLLAHFGFLAPASSWFLQPIPSTPDLLTELQSIDGLPERETFSVSVFFVRSGLQSLEEILLERRVSHDFLQFISSLSWPVDNNGSDEELVGKVLPYYCDKNVELVYHVPSIIPRPSTLTEMATRISSIVSENRVAIVWLEDTQDLLSIPAKFGCPETLVYICVIPMPATGLYQIRLMVTAAPVDQSGSLAAFTFGPLLDGMVLRRETLGQLVRSTAISASLFCLYNLNSEEDGEMIQPIATRAIQLQALAHKYALANAHRTDNFQSFYTSLLFPSLSKRTHPHSSADQHASAPLKSESEVFHGSSAGHLSASRSVESAGMVSYNPVDLPMDH